MRASVLVLGPLVARHGRARVSLPGGCAIGARPIDQHLKGLAAMGARIDLEHGYVSARARRLRGATIVFDVVTVTGTENLMMAAALAKGRTALENAAREPEVEELARVLNKMGAKITGAGTSLITIDGVDELHPIEHSVIPDGSRRGRRARHAGAITRGNILLRDCLPEHLEAVIAKLRAAGAEVVADGDGIRVRGKPELKPTDISTQPFPGFPTDMQAQFMVLLTRARGQSVLSETIFENRYMHVPELQRMGADIVVDGRTAIVRGPTQARGHDNRHGDRPARLGVARPRRPPSPRGRRRSCASITSTAATTEARPQAARALGCSTCAARRVTLDHEGKIVRPRTKTSSARAKRPPGCGEAERSEGVGKGVQEPRASSLSGPETIRHVLRSRCLRGRILDEALCRSLLSDAGFDLGAAEKARSGASSSPCRGTWLRVLIVRDTDVPS